MEEKLNLCWNEFENCAGNTFKELVSDEDFTDVTLVCDEDKQIKAHKVILSACSPLLKKILMRNPHQHPLIYLGGIKLHHIQSIISFIYLGQTEVSEDDLEEFMETAKHFQVKGLVQNHIPKEDRSIAKSEYKSPTRSDYLVDVGPETHVEKAFSENELQVMPYDDHKQGDFELMTKEGFDWQKVKLNGKFPCDRCEYAATELHNLKTHIMSKHEGVRFECGDCKKTFSNQPNLFRHRRSVHIVV